MVSHLVSGRSSGYADNTSYMKSDRKVGTKVLDQIGITTFHDRIGERINILFYYTDRYLDDRQTNEQRETTPLVFIYRALSAADFGAPSPTQ